MSYWVILYWYYIKTKTSLRSFKCLIISEVSEQIRLSIYSPTAISMVTLCWYTLHLLLWPLILYSLLCFLSTFGSLLPAMSNHASCAQVHELPQNHCGDNQEGILPSWLHIYYAHLALTGFEPCVSRISYNYIYYGPCFACWGILVHGCQECVTSHFMHHIPMPKCMSCHKAILVITGRARCFHDYISITSILLLQDLSTLCLKEHLWLLILPFLLRLWSTLGSLVPAMCTLFALMQELLQSHCGDNQEGTLFSWLYIYHAHFALAQHQHSEYQASLMINEITLLAVCWALLTHWHKQCLTVHHVSKYISCHKDIYSCYMTSWHWIFDHKILVIVRNILLAWWRHFSITSDFLFSKLFPSSSNNSSFSF